jgi:hypothetical protein
MDAISVSPALISLLEKYDINCRAQTYINNFPYNFEDRLVLMMRGKKIDFYLASLEDIVIAKLCSMRKVDKTDIESEAVLMKVNWELLETLALGENEAKASALNERAYNDFKSNYFDYIRRLKP